MRIKEIMSALVERPRPSPKPPSSRINTEIRDVFRSANVLAAKGDALDDTKKVVANVSVSAQDDLRADFCVKNGFYHVTTTLDLRKANVNKGQAAIKAITLDAAQRMFGSDVRKIAVYAAPQDADQFRPHIHMLGEYATTGQLFNWSEPTQRNRYLRSIYDAIGGAAGNFSLV